MSEVIIFKTANYKLVMSPENEVQIYRLERDIEGNPYWILIPSDLVVISPGG